MIFQSYLCSPLVVHTVTYKRKYPTRYTMLRHLLTQLTGCKAGAWGRYRGYQFICPLAQSLGYCRHPQSCLRGFAEVSSEGQPLPAKARPRTKEGLKVALFHQNNEPPSRNTYMCEIRPFLTKQDKLVVSFSFPFLLPFRQKVNSGETYNGLK